VVNGIQLEEDSIMILVLYIMITYLVMLGMLIQSFTKNNDVPTEAWFIWLLSPITFPVIIGMEIAEKKE
jgi:pheromone shutdown protein TraB